MWVLSNHHLYIYIQTKLSTDQRDMVKREENYVGGNRPKEGAENRIKWLLIASGLITIIEDTR